MCVWVGPYLSVNLRYAAQITFFAGFRAFVLLAYADSLKENDGYSIRICAGVAICMVSTCRFVRKMAVSSNCA